jgi:hypothetical protein
MRVLGILPFLFFCGVVLFLRGKNPFRDALTIAALITALWIVAGCELLSLFHAVAFWPLLIWWMVPTAVLAWKCWAWRPARPVLPGDWWVLAPVAATAVVLILIFIQAARTPPNNWDALTYHLPRQIYWLQQRHVGLFPTEDARMLIMPPFAEYAGLHLMILSGGDKWLNLIQWFALALTASTASCIARELGCNARLQALAALLVVTVPIAALEAANPKNDVVTAFFLCACAWLGLKAYNSGKFSAPLIGAAFGLLLLSKSTGMLFGLPLAAWIAAACVRIAGMKRAVLWGTAVALIALAINAGFYIRLTGAFGSPLGPPIGKGAPPVANTIHTPRAVLSNLLRNTAMHLATGNASIDLRAADAVAALHRVMALDVNDPRTTFVASAPFGVTLNLRDEDRAKAPVHVLLGIAVFAIALSGFFRPQDKWKMAFVLTPFLGFAVFCFVLAWQEWHSRLHIPVLCLVASVAPYALRRATMLFAGAALAVALVSIITNEAKPLFHLKKARHRYQSNEVKIGLQEAMRAVIEHRPRVIGIFVRPHRCEYFLLSSLLKVQKSAPVFVKLNNSFPKIKSPYLEPDLAITWQRDPGETNGWFCSRYSLVSRQGAVGIFLPVR